jgi:O-phospho-L-seryl-tRNASec:L-selenocysteinyl-tRNA synthase
MLMDRVALMDSNNFAGNTGIGEREARIFSPMVRTKNFGLGHGIGRSGDVNAL